MRFPFVQRKLSTAVSEYTFKQNGPLNSRSGSSGIIATVFGASGFVGRYVTGELGALAKSTFLAKSATNRVEVCGSSACVCCAGKAGSIVFVAHRGEEYEVRHLKVCGDLGSVQPALFELRDKASVLKAMERSNVVINCVGKEHNTFHYTTEQANVDSARIIAEVPLQISGADVFFSIARVQCGHGRAGIAWAVGPKLTSLVLPRQCAKEVGVKKFVHLSCLAAHEHAPSALGRQKVFSTHSPQANRLFKLQRSRLVIGIALGQPH
jgi:hypothetical protein